MQEAIGIFPCVAMSLMSDSLLPSACENDIAGAVSMYILQLASEKPAALFDLNNNYGNEPDKMILFHCCNCALSMLDKPSIAYNELAATVMGEEKASATYFGRIKQGPFTYLRISTDDNAGNVNACLGQGQVTTDSVETFGGVGVVHIQELDRLLNYLCSNGYEHHVAITLSNSQKAIKEALTKYMNWKLYCHE
jgi:L-fucose isomerase-like protein